MSLTAQISAGFEAVGADIKAIRLNLGTLSNLNTVDKSNLVNSLNEVLNKVNTLISDVAGVGITDKTWSADKIIAYVQQVKSDILGGTVPSALDTLLKLAQRLEDDATELNAIMLALGKRVAVDQVQTFTAPEQTQARSNINAASDTEFQQFKTDVGDTNTDFVATYTAAKA